MIDTLNQPGFDFPMPFTEKYRPRVISDFIGLDKPRKIAQLLIDKPFVSDWLFIGPSGTGKTSLSMAIADQMPAEFHHIPARACDLETIKKTFDACYYMPRLRDWTPAKMHLVLIDEAHTITQAAQDAMLSKLDATGHPPNTIVIATCNGIDSFEKPFLSRFRQVEFSSYGMNEKISGLLERIWELEVAQRVSIEPHANALALPEKPNFSRIAKDSTNNVRDALMNLEVEVMTL